jgi:hypothetical protein
MAIVRSRNAPSSGPEVIGKALRDLAATRDDRFWTLGGNKLNLWQPFPVYRLDMKTFRRPEDIDKAEMFGWRYLVEDPHDQGAGFADVKVSGGSAQFTSFSKNKNAYRLIEAAHLAQAVAEKKDAAYEARILEIPQVYVSAIWLAGPESIFIPYIDRTKLFDPHASVQVRTAEYLFNISRSPS